MTRLLAGSETESHEVKAQHAHRGEELTTLQQLLCARVRQSQEWDIRNFEMNPREQLVSSLLPACTRFADDVLQGLDELLQVCGKWTTSNCDSSAALRSVTNVDQAMQVSNAQPASLEVIEQIGFMARMELRQHRVRLSAIERMNRDQLLVACDEAVRNACKGVEAVDQVVSNFTGNPPLLDYMSQLATSLLVRQEYARFARRVRRAISGSGGAAGLATSIRNVGNCIAVLIGRDAYSQMRIADRLMIREMQQRVIAWHSNEADIAAGQRLVDDFDAALEVLSLVSQRTELRSHDVECLQRIAELLRDGAEADQIAEAARPLEGLDRELDGVLRASSVPPSGQLRAVVSNAVAAYIGPRRGE